MIYRISLKFSSFFLIQKLQRRIEVLQKMEMDQDAFSKMNKLLSQKNASEFMSSEESDNEDIEETGPKRRITKPLPWERKKLRKLKKKLDNYYFSNLTESQKRTIGKQVRGKVMSQRVPPKHFPEWAVKVR